MNTQYTSLSLESLARERVLYSLATECEERVTRIAVRAITRPYYRYARRESREGGERGTEEERRYDDSSTRGAAIQAGTVQPIFNSLL